MLNLGADATYAKCSPVLSAGSGSSSEARALSPVRALAVYTCRRFVLVLDEPAAKAAAAAEAQKRKLKVTTYLADD